MRQRKKMSKPCEKLHIEVVLNIFVSCPAADVVDDRDALEPHVDEQEAVDDVADDEAPEVVAVRGDAEAPPRARIMLVEPARGTIATFRETLAAPRPRAARKGVMRKSREMTIMTARSQRGSPRVPMSQSMTARGASVSGFRITLSNLKSL